MVDVVGVLGLLLIAIGRKCVFLDKIPQLCASIKR